jgi:hypothetical protein
MRTVPAVVHLAIDFDPPNLQHVRAATNQTKQTKQTNEPDKFKQTNEASSNTRRVVTAAWVYAS